MALDLAHVIIQDLDGTILLWNTGVEQLYGWTHAEATGRKSHELLKSELPEPFERIQAQLLEHGTWSGEFRQRRRDNSLVWVASRWALHRDANGQPVSVIKVNNDISELKRTADALRTSEATTRSLFENASQGILTTDRDGRIVDANAMTQKLFGYSRAELVGEQVEMLLPEGLRARHVGHRAGYAREPHARPMGLGIDLVARRKDGSEFPVEISLSYVDDRHSALIMAFISDITARKQAEGDRERLIQELERALTEKTILLKEVHHRVKNNLAVIAGLLGMQSDVLQDEQGKLALKENQRRVTSMALIHEYLYATEHLDRVNFGQYVGQFVGELCESFGVNPAHIEIDLQVQEIDLPVHRAIPCGLILNELLSNALKYAFPNDRAGRIIVRFQRVDPESEQLLLSCHDDGIGMPEGFDWQHSKSLGLRIVNILTRQIDGTLTLDRTAGGTRFELRFLPHQS